MEYFSCENLSALCSGYREHCLAQVRELQARLGVGQSSQVLQQVGGVSPLREDAPPPRGDEATPVPKMAERVRLRKLEGSQRQILGSEMAALGVSPLYLLLLGSFYSLFDRHCFALYGIVLHTVHSISEIKTKFCSLL